MNTVKLERRRRTVMRDGPGHMSQLVSQRRGVSPIIATILLVAITVVIAAVLYILVSGYLTSHNSPPLNIELGNIGYTHTGNPPTAYYINFGQVSASTGMATSDFGFKIISATNNSPVSYISVTIVSHTGVTIAVFNPSTQSWNASITFPQGDMVSFDTGLTNLQGSGDPIVAYGLGQNLVSGGYAPGV